MHSNILSSGHLTLLYHEQGCGLVGLVGFESIRVEVKEVYPIPTLLRSQVIRVRVCIESSAFGFGSTQI